MVYLLILRLLTRSLRKPGLEILVLNVVKN